MVFRRLRFGRIRVVLSVLGVACLLTLAAVLPTACASLGARPSGESLKKMKKDNNYRGSKFVNPEPTIMMARGSFWRMMAAWVSGKQVREPAAPLPVVEPEPEALTRRPAGGLAITWMGHAMALVQMDEYRVLTDPVFSERVTPVPGVGPKRFHAPPVAAEDMPPLDAVIISHDHYDHLDMPSIKALSGRTGLFIVPLGIGAHLRAWEVPEEKIVELGWWQSKRVGKGLIVVATPARHFSGRGPLDRNKTLWASFALLGRKKKVYFGGDTGMFDTFDEIGERLGPFDVTLMPIGAYSENWPEIHLNPEEAVTAHGMVRGGLLMPIHWGTFNLALHSWTEPAERLLVAARAARVKVAVPRPGQVVVPGAAPAPERWWPEVPWEGAPEQPTPRAAMEGGR